MHHTEAATAWLVLPDDRVVLQRRPNKALMIQAGLLGMFGGKLEPGESADQALRREMAEETEISSEVIAMFGKGEPTIYVRENVLANRPPMKIYTFFEQIEELFVAIDGEREVYTLAELSDRTDVTPSVAFILEYVMKERTT